MSLLPLQDALERVLAQAGEPPGTLEVPLPEALGHTLASTLISPLAVPGEDNSAMDGYALRAAEASSALTISQRIAAGAVGEPLLPGTAARIFTGAAVIYQFYRRLFRLHRRRHQGDTHFITGETGCARIAAIDTSERPVHGQDRSQAAT